jgi:hypothetical protein
LDAGRDLFEQQLREHEKNEDDETALSRLQGPEFLQSLAAELKVHQYADWNVPSHTKLWKSSWLTFFSIWFKTTDDGCERARHWLS